MIRLAWRLLRLLILCLVVGVGLYFGGPYLLTAMGQYLITQHFPARGDLIVVLGGEPYLRVPEAARLYHDGQAPAILITNEVAWPGFDALRQQGIVFPDSQEISLRVLEELRVPRSAVHTIAERANSTRAEMEAVAADLKGRPAKRLIIVTSKSHTTRAYKIFSAGLGPDIRIQMHPVKSDPFDPAGWWRTRADFKQALHEYQGLADFWRIRAWGWIVGQLRAAPPPVTVREVRGGG